MSEYRWTGQDGQVYHLDTVTDSHLRYYLRMMQERQSTMTSLTQQEVIQKSIEIVRAEVQRRGLEPLPIRSVHERHLAEMKRRQVQSQEDIERRQEIEEKRQRLELLRRQREEAEQLEAAIRKEQELLAGIIGGESTERETPEHVPIKRKIIIKPKK